MSAVWGPLAAALWTSGLLPSFCFAAVTSAAAPGWSLYGSSTNASSNIGLGAALDEKYMYAQGYDEFKKVLRKHLEQPK